MMTDINDVANGQIIEDLEMESKKKKLHPRPDGVEQIPFKKMKTSAKNSQEKENICDNKEKVADIDSDLLEEESHKFNNKSASKPKSRLRSKSRSNFKSNKSRSRSRSKASDLTVSCYTLRPRKNIDYTNISPCDVAGTSTGDGTGNGNECKHSEIETDSDASDVSFRADELSHHSQFSCKNILNTYPPHQIDLSPHICVPDEEIKNLTAEVCGIDDTSIEVNIDEADMKKEDINIDGDDSQDEVLDKKALAQELEELKGKNFIIFQMKI
jgi:hypothetical protein